MYTRFRSCKCRLLPFSTPECNLFYVPTYHYFQHPGRATRAIFSSEKGLHTIPKALFSRLQLNSTSLKISVRKCYQMTLLVICQKLSKKTKCSIVKNFLNVPRNSLLTDRPDRLLKENETFLGIFA